MLLIYLYAPLRPRPNEANVICACLLLADLAVLDRTEQGEQLVHLHLLDVEVVQEVTREGHEVIGGR